MGIYGLQIRDILTDIMSLVSVGSKRFLTNKVDRSVTGLIVQQQCVGPLQIPLSNVAVVANSYTGYVGTASSIGEQPIKGLIDPCKMARLTVAEMLTNLMWAEVSSFEDIVCSANWMWPLKNNKEEREKLYIAVRELCKFLKKLGISIDGGKDSLSMSVKLDGKNIKSPGTFVISGYVSVNDINQRVQPYFKTPGSHIIYIDISRGKYRI